MSARRFAPLFWCQFFSAFNDNFVRQMLAMLILFRLGEDAAGSLITLAVGIFIAPSLLLSALGRKSAALEDAQGRLETRLRWGVALLEARKAAALARGVLAAWRARAARARYARSVVGKLRQRAGARSAARAVQAWGEHCEVQVARRQRLRQAVRRMALLKLDAAFSAWRGRAQWTRAEAEAEDRAAASAAHALRVSAARRALCGWRGRAQAACLAGQLLQGVARRAMHRTAADVFSAWRAHSSRQGAAVVALAQRAAAGRRQAAQWAAIDGWRLAVDDQHGERMQLAHAARVMARQCALRALQAWRSRVVYKRAARLRWRQVESLQRHRHVASALGAWRGVAAERRDGRQVFVRFVNARAERRMQLALHFWRCHAHTERRTAAAVQFSVQRTAAATCARALHSWRCLTAREKADRHRVSACQRRQRLNALRGAFAAWRAHVAAEADERHVIRVCCARADRRRLGAAFAALRSHAQASALHRQRLGRADAWHAERLQARATGALLGATDLRRGLLGALRGVAQARQAAELKDVLGVWLEMSGRAQAQRLDMARVQRRRALLLAKAAFRGWRGVCCERRWEQVCCADSPLRGV
jgi:Tfp pilus assembly protein PilV